MMNQTITQFLWPGKKTRREIGVFLLVCGPLFFMFASARKHFTPVLFSSETMFEVDWRQVERPKLESAIRQITQKYQPDKFVVWVKYDKPAHQSTVFVLACHSPRPASAKENAEKAVVELQSQLDRPYPITLGLRVLPVEIWTAPELPAAPLPPSPKHVWASTAISASLVILGAGFIWGRRWKSWLGSSKYLKSQVQTTNH